MPAVSVIFNSAEVMKVDLTKECYVIGRQEDCDIHIDNLGISRQHARFVRDGSLYRLEDMNSSNGCFVNGKAVKRYNLNDGDVITIGKYEIRYSGEASAEDNTISNLSGHVGTDGSMNTMEMDGNAIRKRFEEMRRSGMGDSGFASGTGGAGNGGIGDAELRASRFQLDMMQRTVRRMQLIVVLVVLVAIGLGVALFLRGGQ